MLLKCSLRHFDKTILDLICFKVMIKNLKGLIYTESDCCDSKTNFKKLTMKHLLTVMLMKLK